MGKRLGTDIRLQAGVTFTFPFLGTPDQEPMSLKKDQSLSFCHLSSRLFFSSLLFVFLHTGFLRLVFSFSLALVLLDLWNTTCNLLNRSLARNN